MTPSAAVPIYTKKDFVTDQDVRWCPGCGDYAILNGVQQAFAGFGVPKENLVIVSGIGCSSRFPYYMDVFGFHTIHGRAPAVASGLKIARPELEVWVVTGDGDALSIGGNHLIHAMRRNMDLKVLLFNNRIYGLTKGQYSPTTAPGLRTPSTPMGSLDAAFNPVALALGAGATFVARTVDTQIAHLKAIVEAAHRHRGFAFVEILQNCVIFNDGVFDHLVGKEVRDERLVDLRAGQPMTYGKGATHGLRFTPTSIETCPPAEADVWDVAEPSGAAAYRICQGDERGALPVPIGIFRAVERPALDAQIHEQLGAARKAAGGDGTLESLLASGETWQVG